MHIAMFSSKNNANALYLVVCLVHKLHIWITQDGWVHMLPNWQLDLLSDPPNLHFNVDLFSPHNYFFAKNIVKHPNLCAFERPNRGWRDKLHWSWKRVDKAKEIKVRHRMWSGNKLEACTNTSMYLNFNCFKSHLSEFMMQII